MKFQDLRSMARRIKRDGVTLWFACRDARTPWWIKLLAGLTRELKHLQYTQGDYLQFRVDSSA